MKNLPVYAGFMLAVMIIGGLIGYLNLPGAWYAGLQKPFFTPPDWVFGPVWTTLYALIGWVGARLWLHGGDRGLWVAQMLVNFSWSPVFFGQHLPGAALVIILVLLGLILLFLRRNRRRDRISAALFLPYAAWVALATALNAGIVWLN